MQLTAVLTMAVLATSVFGVPVPQLAGEGAACDSILSSTDSGVGYGVEDALDNLSKNSARQLAGEGAACDSILSSTDNGVGYGVEDALDNLSEPTATAGGAGVRRQLDKIAEGVQTLSQADGTGELTSALTTGLVGVDGTSTSAAANAGAEVGDAEEGTLEAVGNAVPRW